MLKKAELPKQKCTKCRCFRLVSEFGIRKYDIPYKTCQFCREKIQERKCPHGRQKPACRECGGSSICPHGKQKYQCKDCGGNGICQHGKRKADCVVCQGTNICVHDRVRSTCKKCSGSSICAHDKHRYLCKICGGSGICQHDKQERQCKKCNGAAYCEHGRLKHHCLVCVPQRACQHCHVTYVAPGYRFKPYCFRCYCVLNPDADIPRQYKLREHYFRDAMRELFPGLKMVFDKAVDGGCSGKRPDVRIECLTHTIIVECDENQHRSSSYSCEDKRTMELFRDLGNRPIVVVRFNPDSYVEDGQLFLGCFRTTKTGVFSPNEKEWSWRLKELQRTVCKHLKTVPEKELTEEYLFYSSIEV